MGVHLLEASKVETEKERGERREEGKKREQTGRR